MITLSDLLYDLHYYLSSLLFSGNLNTFFSVFFPFVIFFELPYNIIVVLYSIKSWLKRHNNSELSYRNHPLVTVVITCYNETFEEVQITVQAIAEQIYAGKIEAIVLIDNASVNKKTADYAKKLAIQFRSLPNRNFQVVEKELRGGHASSMNLGLKLARGEVLIMVDADTSLDNQSVARGVAHFADSNVIAVSGAVRVRNIKDALVTRLQAIEYMLGIQLGRFGLAELNVLNTISGAFGIFRTSFLRQIGGWLNGSAEDFDLTFRMHAYISRYPHLKIVHEPLAIAWTAAPTTWKILFKQRLRWDGDIYYIYVRRHWRKFSSTHLGVGRTLFFTWYGLYYQISLPFVIVFYTIYMLIKFNLTVFLVISLMIYLYYFFIGLFMYLLFLLLVSERPKHDIFLMGWLFLMPIYQQILRYASALFILNEMLFKGHQDSTMAPWWVIKKTK